VRRGVILANHVDMRTILSNDMRRAVGLCALLGGYFVGILGTSGCDGAPQPSTGGTGGTGAVGGMGGMGGTVGGMGGMGGIGGTGGTGGAPTTGGSGGTGGTTTTGGVGGMGVCDPQCAANQGIASECIAITDNAAQAQFGLRMAQITLEKPTALTNPLVAGIIESGVTMNLPDCNLTGDGTFSWLIELDTGLGTLKTGGATPVADPTAGYCFVNEMLGTTQVSPVVLDAAPDAGGTIDVAVGGDVVVPIFLGNVASYVLLPLSDFQILGAALSPDQNCIGVYNADQLSPADACEPSGSVSRFTNAGMIEAYITLEAADSVIIDALGQSLCVLLTGDAGDGGMPKKCSRDPGTNEIIAKGDWCSMTNMAGGCADSYQVTGEFAASAVQINGDCP
jgi:hypothetical protein